MNKPASSLDPRWDPPTRLRGRLRSLERRRSVVEYAGPHNLQLRTAGHVDTGCTVPTAAFGLFQIEVHPSDLQKMAFICHRGLFKFTRLPFGFSNSPASFQHLMDVALGDAKYEFAVAYMDDVHVFLGAIEERLEHLRIAFER